MLLADIDQSDRQANPALLSLVLQQRLDNRFGSKKHCTVFLYFYDGDSLEPPFCLPRAMRRNKTRYDATRSDPTGRKVDVSRFDSFGA